MWWTWQQVKINVTDEKAAPGATMAEIGRTQTSYIPWMCRKADTEKRR